MMFWTRSCTMSSRLRISATCSGESHSDRNGFSWKYTAPCSRFEKMSASMRLVHWYSDSRADHLGSSCRQASVSSAALK
ncbi:Uncharacterised protein [Mycobacteroides abscessus subsp. massiliense]|nr:Uncharacterised protein [Mycobacteroides abscessus subsp. massiliense]